MNNKFYFIVSKKGNVFYNFITVYNQSVKLKNTRRKDQSILYTFTDALKFRFQFGKYFWDNTTIVDSDNINFFLNKKPQPHEQTKKRAVD